MAHTNHVTRKMARGLTGASLYQNMASSCPACSTAAKQEIDFRGAYVEKASDEFSRGEGQYVNDNPKVRSPHDLGFLIRDKSGELTQIAVKDIDSAMLHDMLDRADEIVISRVDVK